MGITDSKTFDCRIINKSKYNELSENDKKLFEFSRNAILEIFPHNNGVFEDYCLEPAESFGFVMLRAIKDYVENEVMTKVQTLIAASASASATNTGSI